MSIFDATDQTTRFTIDDAYRFKIAFQEALDALKEAKQAVEKAEATIRRVGGIPKFRLTDAEERHLTATFWLALLRSLPVRKVMSEDMQKRMDEWVGSPRYHSMGKYPRNFPEFIIPNIMQKVREYEDRYDFYLRHWALTVFKSAVKYPESVSDIHIPRQILFRGLLSYSGVNPPNSVAELDRLYHYLDGHPLEEPFNPYKSPLVQAISATKKADQTKGETDYFKFRLAFGNGNIRLAPKQPYLTAIWESLARDGFLSR